VNVENKEVTIKLPVQQWNIILNALGARPFAEVADLIANIKVQAEQQINEKPPENSEE